MLYSIVDFFIKNLHFFGKFIANTASLDNNRPVSDRYDNFRSVLVMLKAEKALGPNFPWCFAGVKQHIRHVLLALSFKITFRLTVRAFKLALTFSFDQFQLMVKYRNVTGENGLFCGPVGR